MQILFISKMIDQTRDSTVSTLTMNIIADDECDNTSFHIGTVIEDGYRKHKEYGQSRVEPGLSILRKRTYGAFYEKYAKKYNHPYVLELIGILNFTDILVHIGNKVTDTEGCMLVNTGFGKDSKGNYVGNGSEKAYLKIFEILKSYNYPDEMYWRIIR